MKRVTGLVFGAWASLVACSGEVFVGGSGGQGAGAAGGGGVGAGGVDFTACDGPGQCALRPESCCGSCGAATQDDMIGLHANYLDDYATANCATVDCPACFQPQDPNLFAYCDAGHCRATDLAVEEFGACVGPEDCVIRWGLGCCEGCGLAPAEQLVGLNASSVGALLGLVCPPEQACPECAVQYPDGAVATCIDGRCTVVTAFPPGG